MHELSRSDYDFPDIVITSFLSLTAQVLLDQSASFLGESVLCKLFPY